MGKIFHPMGMIFRPMGMIFRAMGMIFCAMGFTPQHCCAIPRRMGKLPFAS
jgi:hypothetical protein